MSIWWAIAPDPLCPKCGEYEGFKDVKPTFRDSDYNGLTFPSNKRERLEFSCATCGYTVETPTVQKEEVLA